MWKQGEGWEARRETQGPRKDRACVPRHTACGQPRLERSSVPSDCRSSVSAAIAGPQGAENLGYQREKPNWSGAPGLSALTNPEQGTQVAA